MAVMVPYYSATQYVARCPECDTVCAYWDDDDLNDAGELECSRCATVHA
jgi:hypothetical protein